MIIDEKFDGIVNQWLKDTEIMIDEWDKDTTLFELGAESIDTYDLTFKLENAYGFALEGAFQKEMTFGEIWEQVREIKKI